MTTFTKRTAAPPSATRQTIARTRLGELRGSVADGVHTFKGIAYAAPPFGPNRLRPPQPVEAWSGVRDATAYGPKPPQFPYPPPWDALLPERGPRGEDCLNLNIWTPDPGSAGLPVMVWIPGGMFEGGSGASYDGSSFARDGIVCVTINYRVGAEGFLYLSDGCANLGLLDQIAALEWVRAHIAAFGGDPGEVTVFGQSAGAMSIGTLLSMPRAEGLFRRAIVQSGGAQQVISAETARKVATLLAERLGVEPTREAIAAIPADRVLQAQAAVKADLLAHPDPQRWGAEVVTSLMPWQPVVEGDILPDRPLDRIGAGAGGGLELVVGSTSEEWNFFLVPDGTIDRITAEALAAVIAARGLPVEATLATYRSTRPAAGPGELLSSIQGDWYFRIPALRLAETHAASPAATYMYDFAWRSPQFRGRLGAAHGLDVPFVFDALRDWADPFVGADPPRSLADAMHGAWVAFAKTGDCGWPKYDLRHRATMRFDTTCQVVSNPHAAERGLWDGVR